MGDEIATPADAGTVAPADTPDQGTGTTSQDNWQERYTNLQPEFTRATQDRDRYRSEAEQYQQLLAALSDDDPDIRQQAAAALNLSLAEDPDDTQDIDLDPRVLARIDALEQQIATREQHTQEQAAYQQYRQAADKELASMGVPQGLYDVIADTALGMAEQTGSAPDLKAAIQQLEEMVPAWAEWQPVQNHVKKAWEQTKRAPHFTQTGVPGQGAPNLDEMSRSDRIDYMTQRMADMDA